MSIFDLATDTLCHIFSLVSSFNASTLTNFCISHKKLLYLLEGPLWRLPVNEDSGRMGISFVIDTTNKQRIWHRTWHEFRTTHLPIPSSALGTFGTLPFFFLSKGVDCFFQIPYVYNDSDLGAFSSPDKISLILHQLQQDKIILISTPFASKTTSAINAFIQTHPNRPKTSITVHNINESGVPPKNSPQIIIGSICLLKKAIQNSNIPTEKVTTIVLPEFETTLSQLIPHSPQVLVFSRTYPENFGNFIIFPTEPAQGGYFDEWPLNKDLQNQIFQFGFVVPTGIQKECFFPITLGQNLIISTYNPMASSSACVLSIMFDSQRGSYKDIFFICSPARMQKIQSFLVPLANINDFPEDNFISYSSFIQMDERDPIFEKIRKIFIFIEEDFCCSKFWENLKKVQKIWDFQIVMRTIRDGEAVPKDLFSYCQPREIRVYQSDLNLDGIRQFYIECERRQWKLDVLTDLFETLEISQVIIYVNSFRVVDWLKEQLVAKDYVVSALPNIPRKEAKEIYKQFTMGSTRILIMNISQVRMFDMQPSQLVIFYDIPTKEEVLHAIGKSGKFGRRMVGIYLTAGEKTQLEEIESYYYTQIKELPENIADLI